MKKRHGGEKWLSRWSDPHYSGTSPSTEYAQFATVGARLGTGLCGCQSLRMYGRVYWVASGLWMLVLLFFVFTIYWPTKETKGCLVGGETSGLLCTVQRCDRRGVPGFVPDSVVWSEVVCMRVNKGPAQAKLARRRATRTIIKEQGLNG